MSVLQEQAVQMVRSLSDDNVCFLIEIIQRLMPQKKYDEINRSSKGGAMDAFYRLKAAQEEIKQYLPGDFDPDKELEEARLERYGGID